MTRGGRRGGTRPGRMPLGEGAAALRERRWAGNHQRGHGERGADIAARVALDETKRKRSRGHDPRADQSACEQQRPKFDRLRLPKRARSTKLRKKRRETAVPKKEFPSPTLHGPAGPTLTRRTRSIADAHPNASTRVPRAYTCPRTHPRPTPPPPRARAKPRSRSSADSRDSRRRSGA